ncbi:uncharacterized protein LOC134256366 [Saccostrea cucullata]|uniref:uncharacterized protein LOC134256366 n=1 Tax=Saccostrea cuccullata TaxID=36930 RepID=UPI002ED53468
MHLGSISILILSLVMFDFETQAINVCTRVCQQEMQTASEEAEAKCETEKQALKDDVIRMATNKQRILARQLAECLLLNSVTCPTDSNCFWDSIVNICIPRELAL